MTTTLAGRRIVLGVCGGVAAYKSAELCRELVRRGAHVSPILTAGAERFIGAATLSALASEPARTALFDDSADPSPHTRLGQSADLVVVAPATANLLAAARAGLAGDLLSTTLLATRAPVLLCPAMHTEMWEHAATRDNVRELASRGVRFVLPELGELAGGDVGTGRLADVSRIADACGELLADGDGGADGRDLTGTTVLVSAGGTREPIDPVRYLGNRSSGKQGHAVAVAALARGARVQLVTTADPPSQLAAAVEVVRVATAAQMRDAMVERAPGADVVVMSAAVADFRPAAPLATKLVRRDGIPRLELEPTPDVLAELVAARPAGQVIVGFAAETGDVSDRAAAKFTRTGVDLLVANDVTEDGAGFEHDTNAVTVFTGADRPPRRIDLTSKHAVAEALLDEVLTVRERATRSSRDERGDRGERSTRGDRPRLREVR